MIQTRVIQKKLMAFLMVAPLALIYMVLAVAHPSIFLAFDIMAYAVMVGLMAFMTYVIVKTDGKEIRPNPSFKAKIKVADPRSQVVSAAILGFALIGVSYVGVKSPELLFSSEVLGFFVMAMMITAIAGFLWRSVVPPVPKEFRSRAKTFKKRLNDPKAYVKQAVARSLAHPQAVQDAGSRRLPPWLLPCRHQSTRMRPSKLRRVNPSRTSARLKPKKPKIRWKCSTLPTL